MTRNTRLPPSRHAWLPTARLAPAPKTSVGWDLERRLRRRRNLPLPRKRRRPLTLARVGWFVSFTCPVVIACLRPRPVKWCTTLTATSSLDGHAAWAVAIASSGLDGGGEGFLRLIRDSCSGERRPTRCSVRRGRHRPGDQSCRRCSLRESGDAKQVRTPPCPGARLALGEAAGELVRDAQRVVRARARASAWSA